MAPVKRRRPQASDSDDESSSDESSTTPSQLPSRKRPRPSPIASDSESSDSEQEFLDHLGRLKSTAVNNANGGRAADTNAWANGSAATEAAAPVAADCGILTKVECVNFMCHDNLMVELSPFMNFIVGNNGSGKSAVLTALILCLGGKALATNRASNLKSLIKTGKESSWVRVTIKNEGADAYQHGEYGDAITVERHFTRNGTSGFKLKSATGRIISTKRADLDYITDFFTLQIDNPLNVLSQDQARAFLSSSNPEVKYKFFMKGVQLEQLDQDYKVLEELIDQLEDRLGTQLDDLKVSEERARKAKHKLDLSDKHEATRLRLRHARRQMAWAQVEEQEQLRDSCDGETQEADNEITKTQLSIEKFDRHFQQHDATLNEARQMIEEQQQQRNAKMEEKDYAKAQLDEAKGARQEAHEQERQIAMSIREQNNRIERAEQEIQDEMQRLEDLNGGSDARLRAELEKREGEVKEATHIIEEHRRRLPQLREEEESLKARVIKASEASKVKIDEADDAERRLRELQRTRGQEQSAFGGENVRLLLRAIDNETRFKNKPIGPVGQQIRLLQPKWSSVIESVLGDTLKSFVVSCKADQTILDGIMRRVNCPFPILIGSFDPIDTTQHEPDSRYLTVMRALEFESEAIRRQLVVGQGIEQMLLVEAQDEARRIMYDGPRPRNVKMCFHMHPTRRGFGLRLGFSRAGDPISGPVRPYTDKPRMKTDVESQINIASETLQHLRRERQEVENRFRTCQTDHEKAKQAIVRHQREEHRLRIEIQQAQENADVMRDELAKASVEVGRLDQLKEGLREAQEEKSTHEGSYNDAITAKTLASEKLKPLREACNAKDSEIKAIETRIGNLEEELHRVSLKREAALREKNNLYNKIAMVQDQKARIQRKKEELEGTVAEYIVEAEKISVRVPLDPGETIKTWEVILHKLTKDVARHEKEAGGSRAELSERAIAADAEYRKHKEAVSSTEAFAQSLKNALILRKQRWKKFRQHITVRAKANFAHLLANRGFKGRLLTDHVKHLLDISVEPDIKKTGEGRGAKTLSGGEKSFSQICMLLALWEAMGSPIRCLDEFDVFMDSVNRKISIGLIVEAARNSIAKQFILISPGTKSDIVIKPGVRVTQLRAPERAGQRSLPFAPA